MGDRSPTPGRTQHHARTSGAPPGHSQHPAAPIPQRFHSAPAAPARPGSAPAPAGAHPDQQNPHRADYRAGKNPDHTAAPDHAPNPPAPLAPGPRPGKLRRRTTPRPHHGPARQEPSLTRGARTHLEPVLPEVADHLPRHRWSQPPGRPAPGPVMHRDEPAGPAPSTASPSAPSQAANLDALMMTGPVPCRARPPRLSGTAGQGQRCAAWRRRRPPGTTP